MRHTVVWRVEQRSPNKVSNKLVFFCLSTETLPERSFDAAWACVSFFLPSLSHSYVYCPRGSEISLPSFHSRITQHVGGFYVHLDSSPRAKALFLCLCCPLAAVLLCLYIVIYTYHVAFWLEAREIWAYYWATGKAPFRGHVSNDLLQVLLENSEDITPYYSQKSYCFLWRDMFHWRDHISLPLDVLLLLFKAKPPLDAPLT